MPGRIAAWPGSMASGRTSTLGAFGTADRRLMPVGMAAIAGAIYAILGPHVLNDADSYWHVATGQRILTSLSVPISDPFSHTVLGKEWVLFEWLSQLLMAVGYGIGGWRAVGLLCTLSATLAIYLLARHLVRFVSDVSTLLICLLAVLTTFPHILARPHVFAWPIMIVWVATLIRAVDDREAPPLWLVPVAALWANLHGSFVLGLAVMGLLGLEALVNAWRSPARTQVARSWVVVGALAGLACLLTPQGTTTILHILSVQGQPVQMSSISEWQSPNFQHFQPLAIWMGAFLATALTLGLRVPPLRIVGVLALLLLALRHVRHVELVGLLAPLFLAPSLAATLRSRSAGFEPRLTLPAPVATGLVTASLLFTMSGSLLRDWRPSREISPVAALQAANAGGASGKILNDYDFGGFLISRGVPTFIDGRSDLFGDPFLSEYNKAVLKPRASDEVSAFLRSHDVSWTMLRTSRPIVRFLDDMPGWRRIYGDDAVAVHVRDPASVLPKTR